MLKLKTWTDKQELCTPCITTMCDRIIPIQLPVFLLESGITLYSKKLKHGAQRLPSWGWATLPSLTYCGLVSCKPYKRSNRSIYSLLGTATHTNGEQPMRKSLGREGREGAGHCCAQQQFMTNEMRREIRLFISCHKPSLSILPLVNLLTSCN